MKISFPVGYVDSETMHQLDFEEFLWAIGDERFIPEIEKCYKNNTPMNDAFHKILLDDYFKYAFQILAYLVLFIALGVPFIVTV